jgi:hypothetical protein
MSRAGRGREVGPLACLGALGVVAACTLPTVPPEKAPSGAPINACPAFPCATYTQPGASPVCNGGVCLVSSPAPNLYMVVSLAEDSYFAPSRTFAIAWTDLLKTSPTALCTPGGVPASSATEGAETRPCTHLPLHATETGSYLASPSTALAVSWNLGNPGSPTQLPAHVTYRPLWAEGTGSVDAVSIGLPLDAFPAVVYVDTSAARSPGPNGGAALAFDAQLQPQQPIYKAIYERVITPDPPFDQAFPPDVQQIMRTSGPVSDPVEVSLDTSTHVTPSGSRAIPAFHVTRIGGLTGWTMYLRDDTTKRRLSPIARLSGSAAVIPLPTNHHPADGDAITGVELVVVPPAGQPIPTVVRFPSATQLPQEQPLQELPAAVAVTGAVAFAHTPVEADLVFEAQAIYETGTTTPNAANYEYLGRASARIDATGAATWSTTLPAGQYRVSVRPLDATHGVTVVQSLDVQPSTTPRTAPLIAIAPQQRVTGSADVADGRPLAGAQVEAIPAGCMLGQSDFCMPRGAQGTTSADGSFVLTLDQGSYLLRVEPPDGTALPWISQKVLVGPTPVSLTTPLVVTAPVYVGLALHDGTPDDSPIVGAVVRAYDVPATGPAVLLGRAITDVTGHYDMFIAPSSN